MFEGYEPFGAINVWYLVTRHTHTKSPLFAHRYLHKNEFTGSIAALGKLTKLKDLCVEQNHDDGLMRRLINPF